MDPLDKLKYRLNEAKDVLRKSDDAGHLLTTLYKIADLVSLISDTDNLLMRILDLAIDLTKAGRGMIILGEGEGNELVVKVARNYRAEQLDNVTNISKGIVRQVINENKPFLSQHAQDDERLKDNKSIADHKIKSIICVPIIVSTKAIGAIYVDNREVPVLFTKHQQDFMIAVSKLAGLMLTKAELERKLKEDYKTASDEVKTLRKEVKNKYQKDIIIGESEPIKNVFQLINAISDSNINVLVRGESGTGKELVAKAIHYRSSRSDKPFIAINCAALPETLLQSELFGHEKGAFTNAYAQKRGKLEMADGGTVFLDEIGDMDLSIQAKVLRVLQEKEFNRIGSNEDIKVDIRIIAATNRNLEEAIQKKEFREDLYYRLNVITIKMPPLRERKDDIPLLVDHFLKKYSKEHQKPAPTLSLEALEALQKYDWEGNVRELENIINYCVVLSKEQFIGLIDLPEKIRVNSRTDSDLAFDPNLNFLEHKENHLKQYEVLLLKKYLRHSKGNVSHAARAAGMSRVNLYRLLDKHDIKADDFRDDKKK